MKKNIFIFIYFTIAIYFSCGGGETEKDQKQAVIDSLTNVLEQKDNTVNEFLKSFNEIEDHLLTIQNKQRNIESGTLTSGESNLDVKARIEEEIRSINEAMTESRNKMAELQSRLKKSNLKIVELEKLITRLNGTLAEKDSEIARLNEKLIAMNYKVEGLTQEVSSLRSEKESISKELEQKTRQAEEVTSELNTAYFAIGTKKELQQKGILSKDGSFTGPKRGRQLGIAFNEKSFTKIDIRQTKELILNSKKARLLSFHPNGSFTLSSDKLSITNPEEFWKASRYCVVEVSK